LSLVIDASMTVTWLFDDEQDEISRAALRQVIETGAAVPSIWRLEIGNALRTAVRRRRCSPEHATNSLLRLTRLRIVCDSETNQHAWNATWSLSQEQNLTLYDAAYLELAIRACVPLASRDVALLRAARSMGVETIGD
jgi:predicted nucleic acid-binding protein